MRAQKGFTLIEITVALLVLAFILFSLGVLIPLSQVRIRNTAHRDKALALADDMIGKIRALNWGDVPIQDFSGEAHDAFIKDPLSGVQLFPPEPYPVKDCSFDSTDQGGAVTTHSVTYTYHVTIGHANDPDAVPPVEAQDLKQVKVVVSWQESTGAGGSDQKSVTLQSTLYRRYGSDASAPGH